MNKGSYTQFFLILGGCLAALVGCSSSPASSQVNLAEVNRQQAATIKSLDKEVQRLNLEIQQLLSSQDELQKTKSDLEHSLSSELTAGDLSISMQEKGVVVTVLDRVLFDPGQSVLKPSAEQALDKVGEILNGEVRNHVVYIEGHTDNQPIRRSGWRSNWELSSARAMEVLHYFIDAKNINPERMAATGYGEFQPVVSNQSPEGRLKNRRVEIVISPKTLGEVL